MILRLLLTLLALTGLLVAYLATLAPLILVRDQLTGPVWLRSLAIWGVLFFLSLGPALTILIRKIWLFPGVSTPVPKEELEESLLALNRASCPYRVKRGRRGKFVVEFRVDDPQWCERMALTHRGRLAELRLRLQPATRTVLVTDRFRAVDFSLCPIRVRKGWLALPGLVLRFTPARPPDPASGDQDAPVPRSTYRFRAREMKAEITGLILHKGWSVRLSLF